MEVGAVRGPGEDEREGLLHGERGGAEDAAPADVQVADMADGAIPGPQDLAPEIDLDAGLAGLMVPSPVRPIQPGGLAHRFLFPRYTIQGMTRGKIMHFLPIMGGDMQKARLLGELGFVEGGVDAVAGEQFVVLALL